MYLACCSHLICLCQNILKEHAPTQRKSWAYCTVNSTSTLTRILFANYIYIHCTAPHGVCSSSLGPTLEKDQDLFESTQTFACKMITRKWDKGYDELLNMTNLPSLADRRLYLKLCSLYKIVHNLFYFPSNIIVPKVTRSYTSTPSTLYQPFAHTNCFLNSFVPHCVSHWNWLRESVVSSPSLATFKHSLKQYYMH